MRLPAPARSPGQLALAAFLIAGRFRSATALSWVGLALVRSALPIRATEVSAKSVLGRDQVLATNGVRLALSWPYWQLRGSATRAGRCRRLAFLTGRSKTEATIDQRSNGIGKLSSAPGTSPAIARSRLRCHARGFDPRRSSARIAPISARPAAFRDRRRSESDTGGVRRACADRRGRCCSWR